MIGFPVMIKVAFGTHGKGVFLAENIETLSPIVDYLTIRDGNPVIIEEFVAEAGRKDLRAFVIGDQVIAAMERTARDGDVRANASLGGVGRPVTLTDEEQQIAVKATKAFDLDLAGVDLLRPLAGLLSSRSTPIPALKNSPALPTSMWRERLSSLLKNTNRKPPEGG